LSDYIHVRHIFYGGIDSREQAQFSNLINIYMKPFSLSMMLNIMVD